MKLFCGILLIASLSVCASASVDFWFTSSLDPGGYGLADPTKAFSITGTNQTDYLDGWALANGAVPPPATSDVYIDTSVNPGAFAYIWGRFNDEPEDAKINGIAIGIDGAGAGEGNIAWYRADNREDTTTPPEPEFYRWDGYDSIFYCNPAAFIAVLAGGVVNSADNLPVNMYVGGDDRTFLLGAVQCGACPNTLSFTFGVTPINYWDFPVPLPNPSVNALNSVHCPEPASLMLLALAGVVLRRR